MSTSAPSSLPTDLRFAFVEAVWHADIVQQARDAFFARMAEAGVGPERIDLFDVTGAFEIPLHAQRLARSGRYAAVVGSALVVDDGIYRFDALMQTVVKAMMDVQLATGKSGFAVMVVDVDAEVAGKVVGTCAKGARKLVYVQSAATGAGTVASAKVARPAVTAQAPRTKGPVVITECRDGSVVQGSASCKP